MHIFLAGERIIPQRMVRGRRRCHVEINCTEDAQSKNDIREPSKPAWITSAEAPSLRIVLRTILFYFHQCIMGYVQSARAKLCDGGVHRFDLIVGVMVYIVVLVCVVQDGGLCIKGVSG